MKGRNLWWPMQVVQQCSEIIYSSYEGECLAAMRVVAHFMCYLFGTQFTLVTDHQPLKWLMEPNKQESLHDGLLSYKSMTSRWCIDLELQTLMSMG
jgi:hypothetical protein